jgi:hypothetical protein
MMKEIGGMDKAQIEELFENVRKDEKAKDDKKE